MITIICPRCSTNNPNGSIVCGRCGTPFADFSTNQYYVPESRKRKSSGTGPLLGIIIALLVIFMILMGVLLYMLLKPIEMQPDSENQNVKNIATILGNTTGRKAAESDLNDSDETEETTVVTTNIPRPSSSPVSIPYTNPSTARQRFMNEAAEIENYEYYSIHNVSNQADRNINARVAFEKWDVLLNEIYAHLRNNMSRSEFKALDADELKWIKRKEAAISTAVSQHKGSSKENEARYMTGTSYTKERCYYLISLVEEPQQTPTTEIQSSSSSVKQKYLNDAYEIESYENNIYNATNQTDINLHARIAFEKWDVLLNDIYSYLKGQMSQSEFKALDSDELKWIKKKEAAISSAAAQHSGTNKEAEVRYTTGISYTKDRCYYLISLVR